MEAREIQNRKAWDVFVAAHAPRSGAFLHAWEWADVDCAKRFGLFEGDALIGVACVRATQLPFGFHYASCLRGPLLEKDRSFDASTLSFFANNNRTIFFRCEPPLECVIARPPRPKQSPWDCPPGQAVRTGFVAHEAFAPRNDDGRCVSTKPASPARTLILDLSQSAEQLLSSMHPKTRYNIGLAERKGVQVRFHARSDRPFRETEVWNGAWRLFQETAARNHFRLHPKAHYEAILRLTPNASFLATAAIDGQIVAANLMIDFAGTRTYVHGASSYAAREFMAPYLLHWKLILDAKEKGLQHYDWWGIASNNDPSDPWAGITRFKKGFGGEEVSFPGTIDVVLKPFYYHLYQRARLLARSLRSLCSKV